MDNKREFSNKIRYFVFIIDTVRNIYGNDYHWVLGELMASFDNQEEAIEYIKELRLVNVYGCTIVPVYTYE